MWFCAHFDLPSVHSKQPPRRSKRKADRRREARRLFLEPLEDRSLMAFNFLADYATGPSPANIALTQIDAGSQLDLVMVNTGDSTVSVRLGNPDGTFGAVQNSSTGASPRSVVSGDFTGGGVTDLVTANAADLSLLAGNGDGTFAAPSPIALPSQIAPGNPDPTPLAQHPRSVATGDLNADGKLDLVVGADTYFTQKSCYTGYYGGYYCNYFSTAQGYVNVLLGNGSGGFGPAQVQPLGTSVVPTAVAVGKINGDLNADVITANTSGALSVLLGDGSGAVGGPINSGSGYPLQSISLGDLDGDGKVDTVLRGGSGLLVQKGDGLGSFAPSTSVSTGDYPNSAVMGDVNADGKLDLVAVSSNNQFTCTSGGYYGCYSGYSTTTRTVTVLLGNGLGSFAIPLTSALGSELGSGYLADVAVANLTGDSLPELVTVDTGFNKAIVATNDGDWNPPPSIAISDAPTVVEGDSGTVNAVFTVSIVGAHSGTVKVDYSTAGYTAAAGTDFTTTAGTLSFGPSDSSLTISVPVKGDTIDEYDEQFFVNLSNAVGGVITDSQGIGTIQDDDPAPLVTIKDVSKNEGNRNNTSFSFTVSLSAASGKYVSVDFVTADGTAKVSDSDYFAASGTLYFSPGQTSQTITVLVRGDKRKEANETFFVNLTGANNGTISDSQAVGTIVNDDGGSGKGNSHGDAKVLPSTLFDDEDLTAPRKRK
jgi:hypothetical protein